MWPRCHGQQKQSTEKYRAGKEWGPKSELLENDMWDSNAQAPNPFCSPLDFCMFSVALTARRTVVVRPHFVLYCLAFSSLPFYSDFFSFRWLWQFERREAADSPRHTFEFYWLACQCFTKTKS